MEEEIIIIESEEEQEIITIEEDIEYIEPTTQEKTVIPTKEQQIVVPDDGVFALSKVTVEPISSEYIKPSGTIDITANGEYDVKDYEKAKVETPTGAGEFFTNTITGNSSGYPGIIDTIIKCPIFKCESDTLQYAFNYCNFEEVIIDDAPNVKNVARICYSCDNLQYVRIGSKIIENMSYAFGNCKCTTLDISAIYGEKVNRIENLFYNDTNLTNLTFIENIGKGFSVKSNNYTYYKLDLFKSTKLTHNSLMDVIDKLYDLNLTYDVANGGTLYTQSLTIGSKNLAKLTAEEVAIGTSKGWSIS